MVFTHDEMNLMCIYTTGTRTGLITALEHMQKHLASDETELQQMTQSVVAKLSSMTDEAYSTLELYPDFDEEDVHGK